MNPKDPSPAQFPDTRWSLIQQVGNDEDRLQEWCRGYWRPIRNYICARGHSPDQANELTQQFFENLLGKDRQNILPTTLSGAFRAYLKQSIKNFLIDQWRSSHSQKNKGNRPHLDIDDTPLESQTASSDLAFDRAWVITLLQLAMDRLEVEMTKADNLELFEALSPLVDGSTPDTTQADLAQKHGMSDGAFRVALHRFRQRFRHHIEEEIRQTVSTKSALDEEIRNLLTLWS